MRIQLLTQWRIWIQIRLLLGSVEEPGCLSRIPDPGSKRFRIPDPGSASTSLIIFNPKIVDNRYALEICRDVHP